MCSIATTFSTRTASLLLDEICKLKTEAATYLEIIKESGVLWRSSQWYSDSPSPVQLPPRYRIITSNTSESASSLLSEARDLGWLKAVNKILDIMSMRVCTCR